MLHITALGPGAMGTIYAEQLGVSKKVGFTGTGVPGLFTTTPALPQLYPNPIDELYISQGAVYNLTSPSVWNVSTLIAGDGTLNNFGSILTNVSVSFFTNVTFNNYGSFVFGRNLTVGQGGHLLYGQQPQTGWYVTFVQI
jgi:hypothetical protein